MKYKRLLVMLTLAISLCGCGQKEYPAEINTGIVKEAINTSETKEEKVDFTKLSFIAPTFLSTPTFSIISTLPYGTDNVIVENGGLSVSGGTMIYTDNDLGEVLLLAKKYLYIEPELTKYQCSEDSEDYAEILLQCVLINHWDETKELYGEIVSSDISRTEISNQVCSLLSEEQLKNQKSLVNILNNNLYKMNKYICYDLDGNELGQLTVGEIEQFITSQEAKEIDQFINYCNSLETFPENGSVSKIDTTKEYKINKNKIVNDGNKNYYVTVSTNSQERGYELESYWMFSKVLAGPNKEIYDIAETELENAVIKFEELPYESMFSVMLYDEPKLEISNVTFDTKTKIGDIIYVYNNTEDNVEIEIVNGNKIILRPEETAKVNAEETDEYIVRIKELENAI